MLNHFKFFAFLTIAAFSMSACAKVMIKEVAYADTELVPEDAHPAPIKFSSIKYLLPPGAEIGLESPSRLCWGYYNTLGRRAIGGYPLHLVRQSFHDALEANGYDAVDSIEIDFRAEDELQRAEYFVSARVKDVDLSTCTNSIFGDGTKGKFYMRVDWSVYDALRRHVVYKTTTEGYTHRRIPNIGGLETFFFDAFDMAAHNLSADEDFRALIVEGKKPPQTGRNANPFAQKFKDKPRMFAPAENLVLPRQALFRQAFPVHVDTSRKAVVTLEKVGHGSGIFLTQQGHILTNQHVVGNARRMRVISADKKHKMIAEVLRVDRVRDVALLRLEEVPETLKIVTLPIRFDRLKVSEDVYAIGSPQHPYMLNDTVTKGIVSAHRRRRSEGIRLNYIQADVSIHGGNSGGALLDEKGNLVGVTVAAHNTDMPSQNNNGLNLFIPIEEALDVLDIYVGD